MFARLEVLTPPASEPVELDVVRRHCRIDHDYDDPLLALYLSSARELAESYLNRALITRTLAYTITNSPPPTASPLVPQSLIVFPLNWPPLIRKPIELPRAPLQQVLEVSWGPVDDLAVADEDQYTVNALVEPGQVMIQPSLVPMIPATSVRFEYSAGYEDPDDIPNLMRAAILLLTAHLYENRGDVEADLPQAAYNLLTPYRLWSFGAR
jgi:uncharacterized phiE125 gp8 family phage protein